ncbi:MAG: Riboflavin synthase alpha chain [Candidatus Hodgkinia cicadicola]|nr:MAG: Riboflavin synthase alpha chain [Candidatus Hodgkinia cicadicola]
MIKGLAVLVNAVVLDGGVRIGLMLGFDFGLKLGASLRCSGVCLTIVGVWLRYVELEARYVSLSLSNFSAVARFDLINVEQPLAADSLLHCHVVSWRVESTVKIARIDKRARGVRLWFECPSWLACSLAPTALTCLNGVSLTLVSVDQTRFSVYLTQFSLENTAFNVCSEEFNFWIAPT